MHFYGRPAVDYLYQEVVGDFGKSRVYFVTHHRAHAANGFFFLLFHLQPSSRQMDKVNLNQLPFAMGREIKST